MAHNRKYVPSALGLIQGRVRNDLKLMDQDYIESLLIQSGYCEDAPFTWVGLLYRYGLENKTIPRYGRISKKYGDASLIVDLKMEILQWADRNNLNLLRSILMIAALDALIHAGKKYKRPTELLEAERAKYGTIPATVEECERVYGREE
ncbi:MAG: immunity protein 39 [Proteobacteria bacterium]|nr:immunity protein 39 [Pseudomonadota bacterium]